jgi:hypothetical protein
LVFNQPIYVSHMYVIVFGKDFDLTTNDFFIVITPYLKLYIVGFGLVRIVQFTKKHQ